VSITNNEARFYGSSVGIVITHCAATLWRAMTHLHVPAPRTIVPIVFVAVVITLWSLLGVRLLAADRQKANGAVMGAVATPWFSKQRSAVVNQGYGV
jgi:hypothetical protein